MMSASENDKAYSIVIPHRNDYHRLARLLKSIPERKDIQIIVVDDLSDEPEAVQAVVAELPSVELYSTTEGRGAGAARNVGLGVVTGRFLLFADSDDEFLPGTFDLLDGLYNELSNVTYFLAKGWQEKDDVPSVRADDFNALCHAYVEQPTCANLMSLKLHHCVPWAKVYEVDFVRKTGVRFDETFVANDVCFNVVNSVISDKVTVFEIPIYKVYRVSDSLTSHESLPRLIERLNVYINLAKILRELGVSTKLSGSGFVLRSVEYGWGAVFRVLWLVANSPLRLNMLRLFSLQRWVDFLSRKKAFNIERGG